ncbi:MAG: hypothetical protein ACXAC7_22680 [Candidatus Hodarchaeales archaeon]
MNEKEVKILIEEMQGVIDRLDFEFMEPKSKKLNVSYVTGNQAVYVSIMYHAIEPTDEIEIPETFSSQADDFGFNNSHYKAPFVFKGIEYRLVGFKDDKCLIIDSDGKRFKLKPSSVKKGFSAFANS